MTSTHELAAAVDRLEGHRILVVGDVVLDEYITGRPSRISREAPVLILEEVEREYRAGSAASPAANVVALGSRADVVGVVGTDAAGERLMAELDRQGMSAASLARAADWPTPTKTRVLAQGFTGGLHGRQQVLRLDRVATPPASAVSACARCIIELGAAYDAILLSDYRGGVVCQETVAAARSTGRPIAVDSQGDLQLFRGVDLLKVNQAEAQAALHQEVHAGVSVRVGEHAAARHLDVLGRGESLRRSLDLRHLVVTLGAAGMAVFGEGEPDLVPVRQVRDVFDVTGAGDTVIAVLVLGLVAGLPMRVCAELANAAAALVIRQLGVATVSPAELRAAILAGIP